MEFRRVAFTHPDANALITEVQAEYTLRYGGPDETPLDPTMFDAPQGAFFVGYDGPGPVAMGGWRFRSDVTAFGAMLRVLTVFLPSFTAATAVPPSATHRARVATTSA